MLNGSRIAAASSSADPSAGSAAGSTAVSAADRASSTVVGSTSGVRLTTSHDGGLGVPEIVLDIQVGLGEVDVQVEDSDGGDR